MSEQWSYFTHVTKVPNVGDLTTALNRLGVEGWELVTSMSTVKTWVNLTGNDLVLIFKKAGPGHVPSSETLAAISGYDDVAY